MKSLTQYGCLAEKFWRRCLPKMVAEMERKGCLEQMLMEAEERTAIELDDLRRHLMQEGMDAHQADQRAWEIVRQRYIFLRPEAQPK